MQTKIVSTKSGADRGELVVESVWITGENKQILMQTTQLCFRAARRMRGSSIEMVTLKALDHARVPR